MAQKRRWISGIFIIVAMIATLALFQINRHRQQANIAFGAVEALPPSSCTAVKSTIQNDSSRITLRLDYTGAEALLDALERDSLSNQAVDSLLRIPPLCAMVANVGRFFPEIGVSEFRNEIRMFVRNKKGGRHDRYFRLSSVWEKRTRIRSVITAIQTNEPRIVSETISQLEPYRPNTGTIAVTAYFVAGGVSDGFAFEHDATSFYANLVESDGDLNGVILNMTHEAYHVMQSRAQERGGIDPRWISSDSMPAVERLFEGTLAEGTANHVADPTRSTASGPNIDAARKRYQYQAEPKQIAKNFALFDAVLLKLKDGRVTWDAAYKEGFTSDNDAAFYFVGHEMAKALERYCGRDCVRRLFDTPPVEFFCRYVALYHEHPDIAGHFSREAEAYITSYGNKPTTKQQSK